MITIHIYSDESRHKNERFLLLGGIWINEENSPLALAEIEDLRSRKGYINDAKQHVNFLGEFKWQKISDKYLHVYKELVDIFFKWIEKDIVRFNVIMIDTHDKIVIEYGNIKNEGYYKFLYQLYFHNSKIPAVYKIYPDSITNPMQNNVDFDTLKKCLGAAFKKKFSRLLNPRNVYPKNFVNNITPIDSKTSQFIQVVDVVIGAIGYLQNGLHARAKVKKAKVELMKYIFDKVVLSGAIQICGKKYYVAKSTKFNIWLFKPNKKSS